MINEKKAKRFCCESISLIQNYDKAVADKEQVWHCHHRLEITESGEINSMQELKDRGLYYGRPASELVFMTEHDHRSMHGRNMSEKTLGLLSNQGRGRTHTEETKRRISETKKNHYHPFRGKHLPQGMKQKMSARIKMLKWFNNGEVNVRKEQCPEGFKPGMLPLKKIQSS